MSIHSKIYVFVDIGVWVFVIVCAVLSFCRDPGDCRPLVLVFSLLLGSRYVFRHGERWFPNAEKGFVDPG